MKGCEGLARTVALAFRDFCCADVVPHASQRWKALAVKVFNEGVR
jgi:hypothetical protein